MISFHSLMKMTKIVTLLMCLLIFTPASCQFWMKLWYCLLAGALGQSSNVTVPEDAYEVFRLAFYSLSAIRARLSFGCPGWCGTGTRVLVEEISAASLASWTHEKTDRVCKRGESCHVGEFQNRYSCGLETRFWSTSFAIRSLWCYRCTFSRFEAQ